MTAVRKDRLVVFHAGRSLHHWGHEVVLCIGFFPSLMRRDEQALHILCALRLELWILPDLAGGFALRGFMWSDVDKITRRRTAR